MPRFAQAVRAQEPLVQSRSKNLEEPREEEIRLRAFQIYERRGREGGHEVEDWEQARRELLEERLQIRRA